MVTSSHAYERSTRSAASFVRLGTAWFAACVGLTAQPCRAYDVMLRWTVPPSSAVSGYRVYAGSTSRHYTQRTDVGLLAGSTLNGVVYYLYQGVPLGTSVYLAVTAYSSANLESTYSNEKVLSQVTATPPLVDAGADRSGPKGDLYTLGSSPIAGVSYFWQQTGGPPGTLSSQTISNPRFRGATGGTYVFVVTAYDSRGLAARDSVTVTLIDSGTPTVTPRSLTVTPTPRGGTPIPTTHNENTPTPGTASALIRGNRRSPKTNRFGCQVEWLVTGAGNDMDRFGLPSQKQTCTEGDASCDLGSGIAGVCEFQVRVCLNNKDSNLPACAPNGITSLTVLAPRMRHATTTDSDAMLAADLDALQSALVHLGDPQSAGVGYVYAPPLIAAQQGFCSAPFAIKAPVGKRSTQPSVTLKTRSADDAFPRQHLNVSQLQLTCLPAAQ